MTDERLEQRLAAALVKTAPDDIDGVLSRCQERKGTVIPMKKNLSKKWLRSLAACLAVLLLGSGAALYGQANAVTSVVSLDVNPSIELRVNSRETVVSCTAMNEDAETVLADMDAGADLKGTRLDVAVNAIIGSLLRHGYLEELSSAILISVEDRDEQRAGKLRQELTATVDGALQSGAAQAAVLSQTVAQNDELERQAQEYGISTGKAAMIRRVIDCNGSLSFAELAQLSVEELKDLLEAGAPAMPIGKAAALEAALRYAGLSAEEITASDVDPELDEDPACYEVELELPRLGELEYKVDAYSAEVLSGQADVLSGTDTGSSGSDTGSGSSGGSSGSGSSSGNSGSTDIGLEAAKQAALTHAGLSSATFTKAERDVDDGQVEYELEFYTDSAEYEYTLSGSGKVLDWEKEAIRQQSSGSTEIGLEAAKQAALTHAGLSSATFTRAERDVDDGQVEYELEFYTDSAEYEYTLSGSGKVLDWEKEAIRQQSSGAKDIGLEAAKQAALTHAGLTASQVQELEAEWELEDGYAVYEVEFCCGDMEYEYTIDAATGAVLEHQAERDD